MKAHKPIIQSIALQVPSNPCFYKKALIMSSAVKAYTHAYLYLIREREFVLRDLNVFKIGLTKQPMGLKIGRFDGYKKGSELLLVVECPLNLVEDIEKDLKKRFAEKFQRHDDDGIEVQMSQLKTLSARLSLDIRY